MRSVPFSVCFFVICAGHSAMSADFPSVSAPVPPAAYVPSPPPTYNWSGVYFGGNAGYGWAGLTGTETFSGGFLGGLSDTGTDNIQGALAGGQIGFNFQSGIAILGAEGDWQWSGQKKTTTEVCGVACSISTTEQIKWFATARGRVGAAFDRLLIYGTGGVAWLNTADDISAKDAGVNFSILNASATKTGLAVGGGIEVAVLDNVSLKLEYLYLRFDDVSETVALGPLLGGTITRSGRITDSIARAGLNIRLPIVQ